MPRHKDADWNLGDHPGVEHAQLGLLMDIRDELKALNGHLRCHNFVRIPRILDRIKENTRKKRPAKKGGR